MSTTDISKLVTDWVSDVLGPDIDVAYGCFTRRADACMVKASPGEPWVRRYLSGGGVRRFGYEVYLRVMPRGDEEPRIDALARLRLLGAVESGSAQTESPCAATRSRACRRSTRPSRTGPWRTRCKRQSPTWRRRGRSKKCPEATPRAPPASPYHLRDPALDQVPRRDRLRAGHRGHQGRLQPRHQHLRADLPRPQGAAEVRARPHRHRRVRDRRDGPRRHPAEAGQYEDETDVAVEYVRTIGCDPLEKRGPRCTEPPSWPSTRRPRST